MRTVFFVVKEAQRDRSVLCNRSAELKDGRGARLRALKQLARLADYLLEPPATVRLPRFVHVDDQVRMSRVRQHCGRCGTFA